MTARPRRHTIRLGTDRSRVLNYLYTYIKMYKCTRREKHNRQNYYTRRWNITFFWKHQCFRRVCIDPLQGRKINTPSPWHKSFRNRYQPPLPLTPLRPHRPFTKPPPPTKRYSQAWGTSTREPTFRFSVPLPQRHRSLRHQ